MLAARMLGSVPFFFVALCVAVASEAHASGPVSLRWSAPDVCPTGDDVLEEVNRLLGARAASDERAFDVVAEVRRKDDGTYVVRLEIPGADGPRVREVSAVSCTALGQATALILAMMVDPEAALSAAPAPAPTVLPPPKPTPGQTEPKQTDPGQTLPNREPSATSRPPPPAIGVASPSSTSKNSGSRPPVKKPPKARRLQISGSLQLLGDIGSLPGPAFGVGGALGIFPGRLRFEIGAAYFLEQASAFSTSLPKAGTNVNLLAFHAVGGYAIAFFHPKVEFVPRVRVEIGRFQASSFGVSELGEGAAAFVGVGIGGLVSLRVTRYVRVGLGMDTVALLAHPRFIVTGVGVAHEPSSSVRRLALGVEVRF